MPNDLGSDVQAVEKVVEEKGISREGRGGVRNIFEMGEDVW